MRLLQSVLVVAGVLVVSAAIGAEDASPAAKADFDTSYEQVAAVTVQGTDGKTKLQTLCLDGEGRVLGLVAPPRPFGQAIKDVTSEVHVLSPEGKPVANWKVNFHAHSINVGPDGTIYVAGSGRVARFDKMGKPGGEAVELPHITDLLKDQDALRAKAETQLKQDRERYETSMAQSKKNLLERKEKILAKKPEDRTKTEAKQLEQFDGILKSYEQTAKEYKGRTVETILESMVGRMKIINGIAVSEKDVFIVCGETVGYGFAVWRFDRDLKNPKQVLGGLGGCCGQMDIQVHGADLLVAENTRHRFSRYDRDGKPIAHFGQRGQPTEPGCFGGCCNPMNLRACGKTGEIFTAESEGIVKRFSEKGEFLGLAGTVKVSGGCKNVALGVSPDGSRIYFCDQPGSQVLILVKKGAK